jgi:hypothetical protein
MPQVTTKHFSGGSHLAPDQDGDGADLEAMLRALIADYAELRTQFIALLAKIDADTADTGGDDDYEEDLTPAAQTATAS